MRQRVHIIVSGRVQGVFFRSFVKKTADRLGVAGWVKNLEDGTVEVSAQAEKEVLEDFIDYVRKGPLIAKVRDVDIQWSVVKEPLVQFHIKE